MRERSYEDQKARHMWWVGLYYFLQYIGWASLVPAGYQQLLLPDLLSPPADYALGLMCIGTIVFAKRRAQHILRKIDIINVKKK